MLLIVIYITAALQHRSKPVGSSSFFVFLLVFWIALMRKPEVEPLVSSIWVRQQICLSLFTRHGIPFGLVASTILVSTWNLASKALRVTNLLRQT